MDHGQWEARGWALLTGHGHVLVEIARNPAAKVADIAAAAGITERAVQAILADLEAAGYITRTRSGRRTRYTVDPGRPFRHPAQSGHVIGPFLAVLATGTRPPRTSTPDSLSAAGGMGFRSAGRASRSVFSGRLDAIESSVAELLSLVVDDLPLAAQALLEGHGETALALAGQEQAADRLYRDIEDRARREILLQAPVAGDLRFLLTVLRVAPELERSHDLVMEIASRSGRAGGADLPPRARRTAGAMADLASGAWRQAAGAWHQRDRTTVQALARHDDQLDQLHASLAAELASGRIPMPAAMEMTLVAHFLGRLGDHAVNVARRVAYLAGQTAA